MNRGAGPSKVASWDEIGSRVAASVVRRIPMLEAMRRDGSPSHAFRAFSGAAENMPGVFVDVYGPGAVLVVYEGVAPDGFDDARHAGLVLAALAPLGVKSVYVKPFAKDRSALGGVLPTLASRAKPSAGEALPDSITVREGDVDLEIRLFDGLSTGLFLDQRANRAWVARCCAKKPGARVLNTFAYTCAFSVAAAKAGAVTASVDISARYLEWGKRNFALNNLDASQHRFAKMDTFEFVQYAKRKGLVFDLVILDPPSFAAGNKKKGVKAWSSVTDYARLVKDAAGVLAPGGCVLASTNTRELCMAGRLDREICSGLGYEPAWVALPGATTDFAGERGRFAARAFTLARSKKAPGPSPSPRAR